MQQGAYTILYQDVTPLGTVILLRDWCGIPHAYVGIEFGPVTYQTPHLGLRVSHFGGIAGLSVEFGEKIFEHKANTESALIVGINGEATKYPVPGNIWWFEVPRRVANNLGLDLTDTATSIRALLGASLSNPST